MITITITIMITIMLIMMRSAHKLSRVISAYKCETETLNVNEIINTNKLKRFLLFKQYFTRILIKICFFFFLKIQEHMGNQVKRYQYFSFKSNGK